MPTDTHSAPNSMLRWLPSLVAVAFFMEALDTTILNTAVPDVAAALNVTPLSMKAVLSSYTLSLAVFIPISSWIADRFGTRRVFALAIALFTFGSLLCGLANDIHWLVICRILQGCGGAMMVPVGRLTMVRTFPKSLLIRAMSFVAIPSLVGPMLGPLVGGLIVSYLHWRMIFFVNLPIGLVGFTLVWRYLPDYRSTKFDPLDLIGLILFGSGVALLSYVLEVFGDHDLSPLESGGLFLLSLVLIGGYVLHAHTLKRPLLRLNLFRLRTFRVAAIGNFVTRLAAGGMPFLLPLLYQVGLGFRPVQSGLLIMPQSVAAIALKMAVPGILARFGFRRVLLSNTIFIGATIISFGGIGPATPIWLIVLLACAFGFFSSLHFSSMNSLVYAQTSDVDTSMASTIVSTVQQMSISFGVALSSLVAQYFIPPGLMKRPDQWIAGLHTALFLLGGLTVLSALVFLELREDDGENISQHRTS